jgi:peptidoglycan hydrolase CwlO-like protein
MKIVEDTQKNHNERLQRVEDVQGVAIADLKKDFADMEKKIDKLVENVNTLSTNIHKERGEEAALKYSLEALNKTLLMIQDRIS